MLKQLLNECTINLQIRPNGPILIKSGITTASGPDMTFVTVFRNGREEAYLPGSSLKGVLRSHAERISRTLNSDAACNPFGRKDDADPSCSALFDVRKENNEDLTTPSAYRDSCPICKLFGSTSFAGRLATADAYAVGNPPKPRSRDGVGIDRFTGGASSGAKFELEVLTDGTFGTVLYLRNFELWQLGLVGFLLQDLKDELIRIGMGKSRGLGNVTCDVKEIRLDFLGPRAPEASNGQLNLRGVGSLFGEAEMYGMVDPDEISIPFDGNLRSNGVRTTAIFKGDSFPWTEVEREWVHWIKKYQMPEAMMRYREVRS